MASFKGYKRSIVLDFNYDEVKRGVPDVNKQMALLNAEFRKTSEEIKDTGSNLDKLGIQHQKLTNQLKLQGDKVAILREQLEKLQQAEGNNEKAIARKNIELKNAEAQYNKVQNELRQTTEELDKQARKLGLTGEEWTKLTDKTKQVGSTLTTHLTLPIIAAGGAAFKLAADMDETISKIDVVFGKNADSMKAWAETSISTMGLASQSALDMAAKYGDMSTSMGLSARKTVEMSKNVTQLAADMASFKNISVDMADTALTAIWTGETESLKSLGIVMTQANLQRFAASEGIRKNIKDMTEAEKVQLRYNYIMNQTKNAQGDFARTSDSASNQMRIFKESLKELGASFGEFIVPMVTPALEFLNNLIVGFSSLSDTTKKTITTIAMITAVVGPALLVIGKIAETINNVSGAMKLLGSAGNIFNSTVGNATYITFAKWAAVIVGVVAAVTALVVAINYLVGRGKEMNGAISDITGAMSNTQSQMNNQLQNTARRSYAIGTQYHPGGRALVGEYGPEEVVLPRGSKVLTASETSSRSSSGTTYNLNNVTIQTNNAEDLFNQIQILVRRGAVV